MEIERQTDAPLLAEVIGFRDDLTLVYLLDNVQGLRHGNRVRLVKTSRWLRVGPEMLGRMVDYRGQVIDGRPRPAAASHGVGSAVAAGRATPAHRYRYRPASADRRAATVGKGQRIGLFAGSGVGKKPSPLG